MILATLLRRHSLLTSITSNRRRTLIPSSYSADFRNALSNAAAGDKSVSGAGSEVYRRALKYARPAAVTWSERLHNSVSFIGTVGFPPKKTETRNGGFGVHSMLNVKGSRDSYCSFRVLLLFWDGIAAKALQHLKQDDFIYVSGQLGSYSKDNLNGVERVYYKVTVRELNYVEQYEEGRNCKRTEKSELIKGRSGSSYRDRLHLWQVFFTNPFEWFDNRNTKKNPRLPDFKHKVTHEALWLNKDDPPWVKRQLQLYDSRLSGGLQKPTNSRSQLSSWLHKEHEWDE